MYYSSQYTVHGITLQNRWYLVLPGITLHNRWYIVLHSITLHNRWYIVLHGITLHNSWYMLFFQIDAMLIITVVLDLSGNYLLLRAYGTYWCSETLSLSLSSYSSDSIQFTSCLLHIFW